MIEREEIYMKHLSSFQLHITALTTSILGFVLAAFTFYQVLTLSSFVDALSTKADFAHFFGDNANEINEHIDLRIDAYIDRQKQENLDRKYDAYELAVEKTRTGNHIYGHEDARFTLVGYSDLECPYCKRFHSAPKKVVDSSSGLVNWQWKHLPLPFHNPVAVVEAQASECISNIAGNRAFWVYLQQVFEKTKGNGQGAGDLVSIAQSIGVDEDIFTDCVNGGKFRDKVAADIQQAKNLGINSTPVTFVVDNRTGQNTLLRGAQTPEAIVSTIRRMKKEADASLKNSR